jgi:sensor histidine kinase regulating citrate/malate metabolism
VSTDWTDPESVAAVVGVLAVGALVFYAELVSPTLTARTVVSVVLWITIPMTVAHVVARRC